MMQIQAIQVRRYAFKAIPEIVGEGCIAVDRAQLEKVSSQQYIGAFDQAGDSASSLSHRPEAQLRMWRERQDQVREEKCLEPGHDALVLGVELGHSRQMHGRIGKAFVRIA